MKDVTIHLISIKFAAFFRPLRPQSVKFPSCNPEKGRILQAKEGLQMSERKRKRPANLVEEIIAEQRKKDPTDVLGSWTGVPWDEWDEPVQDADDL